VADGRRRGIFCKKKNNNIKQNNSFNSIEEELEYVKAERDILKKTLEILTIQRKI